MGDLFRNDASGSRRGLLAWLEEVWHAVKFRRSLRSIIHRQLLANGTMEDELFYIEKMFARQGELGLIPNARCRTV
jgi:hypothetical protein